MSKLEARPGRPSRALHSLFPTHIPHLLRLAWPMILSSSAVTVMQIIDALILARHSNDAVAAMGPASLAVVLFQGALFGTAGYAGTFVAHHHGRGDARGSLHAAWLGIHASWISGIAALALAVPLSNLFSVAGHPPQVTRDETVYFAICLGGSVFPVLNAALAGWLSGVARTSTVTIVTFVSFAVNAALAWGLVLGEWGMPRMGMAGAAWATVGAQAFGSILYAVIFWRSGGFSDRILSRLEGGEFGHFLKLAAPMGLRITGEVLAWTLFTVVVGRLGTVELAATSIAFRINGVAFFPAMGLGQAAGILVGHARGSGRDDEVPAIGWQSLAVGELWMVAMGAVFALASAPLVAFFAGPGADHQRIVETGALILKFVAVYCLFDAANVMMSSVLASAGDTQWIARAFFYASGVFLALLWLADRYIPSLVAEWTLATVFVGATALIWILRFRTGAWRKSTVLRESDGIS